jgi:2-dehydro-3-deoxygluconokinase
MPGVITFGEVMMRVSPVGNGRFIQSRKYDILYAGAEANVAASLSYLGISSGHVTCFPDNDLGRSAAFQLRQYGVATDWIVYQDGRLGVYFIEHGASIRSPKIIYDRYDYAFARLDPTSFDWNAILDGAEWFHWSGITPAISAPAAKACADAVATARKKGLKISGDINYRRNLWRYGKTAQEVMPELIESSDVLIAGLADIENCLGILDTSLEAACKKVMMKYPQVTKIATTNRTTIDSSHQTLQGILWTGKEMLKSRAYELNPIIDRVGSGDAFMAGLIYGLMHNFPDQDALDFASAAGALKHTVEGDVNLSSVSEIQAVVKGENVGKLLR